MSVGIGIGSGNSFWRPPLDPGLPFHMTKRSLRPNYAALGGAPRDTSFAKFPPLKRAGNADANGSILWPLSLRVWAITLLTVLLWLVLGGTVRAFVI